MFVYLSAVNSDTYSSTSDLRSYVRGTLTPSNLHSYIWGTGATGSDLYSKVGEIERAFNSRVTGVMTPHTSMASFFSDLKSTVSKIGSDIKSQITGISGELSNIYSMVVGLSSPVSDIYSSLSDLRSFIRGGLSDQISDFQSVALAAVRSRFLISTSTLSDIQSYLVGISGMLSDTHSAAAAAAAAADTTSIASAVWAHANASNVKSQVSILRTLITMNDTSVLSDIRSVVRSAAAAITASVDNASVASAVWAHSRASNIFSRTTAIQSTLDSYYSDLKSAILAGGLNSSTLSDIASNVWAHSRASNLFSMVGGISNQISDFRSVTISALRSQIAAISDQISDFKSDTISALRSQFTATSAELSNVYSMVVGISGNLSNLQSQLTSQLAYVSDTVSDIQSAIDRQNSTFGDATSLITGGLKDRVRTLGWILRNKMKIIDATGNVTLYKDDDTTTAYTVAAGLLDDGTSTVRKRLA